LILVLDNLRSAENVGSILRSADACGIEAVYTTGITPSIANLKVQKAALGAERSVKVVHFATTIDCINDLRNAEFVENEDGSRMKRQMKLVGAETTELSVNYASSNAWEIEESENESERKGSASNNGGVALFVGNEVHGLTPDTLRALDVIVEVPMHGVKNSLNVAAAAAVIMFEVVRQWSEK
jgi:23S rRNA (guanosine2251-2'-O)-methyltransferase